MAAVFPTQRTHCMPPDHLGRMGTSDNASSTRTLRLDVDTVYLQEINAYCSNIKVISYGAGVHLGKMFVALTPVLGQVLTAAKAAPAIMYGVL